MIKTAALLGICAGLFSLSSCTTTSYAPMSVDGVPGWMMSGAELEDEPDPRRPDPTDISRDGLGGPIQFGFKERLETPEQAKKRKKAVDDLFNR